MDFQSESIHIGDDDDDLEILESIAPNDSVKCDSEKPFKKSKTTSSDVWKVFSKCSTNKVKCNGCEKEYVLNGSNYGTSTLKHHINICKILVKYQDVGVMLDHEENLRCGCNVCQSFHMISHFLLLNINGLEN